MQDPVSDGEGEVHAGRLAAARLPEAERLEPVQLERLEEAERERDEVELELEAGRAEVLRRGERREGLLQRLLAVLSDFALYN